MTPEPYAARASVTAEAHDAAGPTEARPGRRPHPLDDDTRRREWKRLFDEYQAEHGAFTEEEIARARKDMYG